MGSFRGGLGGIGPPVENYIVACIDIVKPITYFKHTNKCTHILDIAILREGSYKDANSVKRDLTIEVIESCPLVYHYVHAYA